MQVNIEDSCQTAVELARYWWRGWEGDEHRGQGFDDRPFGHRLGEGGWTTPRLAFQGVRTTPPKVINAFQWPFVHITPNVRNAMVFAFTFAGI